ncbi:hypothetical protein GCM10028809_19300 [Spirosoma gilvum]
MLTKSIAYKQILYHNRRQNLQFCLIKVRFTFVCILFLISETLGDVEDWYTLYFSIGYLLA